MNVMCVEKQGLNSRLQGRSLTRACDRRVIRLAYGPSSGTIDLEFLKSSNGNSE